ncbi:MAG: hypothetical protein J5674_01110 [Candidatus Methanomethylophilaceae archaeon]|nr:hypothetical protein [Candidatus Methanomethylophilaceae archaeon]
MGLFKRNGDGEDIEIISKPRRNECGGTYRYRDRNVPTSITSNEMVFFEVTSALGRTVKKNEEDALGYVSAYASPSDSGTFLYLETAANSFRGGDRRRRWGLIKDDLFPDLAVLVSELGLVKGNGLHSTTHGLPENFGGDVLIRYASGEKISFSDNRSPIISEEAARRIVGLFRDALEREKVPLPDVSSLTEIRFSEKRKDGFTEAMLRVNSDGTGTNIRRSQYPGTEIFESEKSVGADTVVGIKETIERCGLLAQAGLPDSAPVVKDMERTMVFVFSDGKEVVVNDCKVLPNGIRGGFFDIELEMTAKRRGRGEVPNTMKAASVQRR